MNYIGIDEAAKKWGLSKRFVQLLCSNGRIEGATRLGRAWMIPHDAKKPIDGRTKAARSKRDADMPLPRKTPFLYMTIQCTRLCRKSRRRTCGESRSTSDPLSGACLRKRRDRQSVRKRKLPAK